MVFLPQEVIARKRDGEPLSNDEIGQFVTGISAGTVSDAQIAAFAMAVYFNDMDVRERVALTLAVRDSGSVLNWDELDGPVVDKHSTGGVGDNVSLMLGPMLAACDVFVPMISGRGLGHTGGTLDKFDAIPGYDTAPGEAKFRQVTKQVGCAIIGQTADLAPVDKVMYGIRDVTATVENVSLITASILSKKMAAGLGALVLDVKVGSGAFMRTPDEAMALAKSLVSVANDAGIATDALMTDMNEALASAAGNALEVRSAVDFLTGVKRDPRLLEVTMRLCMRALVLAGAASNEDAARVRLEKVLDTGVAAEKFGQMVAALGGPADFVEKCDGYLETAPIVTDIFPTEAGVVSRVNAREIGMSVVMLGGGRTMPSDKIDFAVGFDEIAGIGAQVGADAPIARLHARDEASATAAAARFIAAYTVGEARGKNDLIPVSSVREAN